MSRGTAWDELPRSYAGGEPISYEKPKDDFRELQAAQFLDEEIPQEKDLAKEAEMIMRRIAFGGLTGAITGAAFGVVDVMRDVKTVSAKKSVAVGKIARSSGMFAGFFGAYQGVRRIIDVIYPQPPLDNVLTAAILCIPPLAMFRKLRPILGYSVMLVVLDGVNEFNDK